jgi:tetratricopeptide (TPR) repeat protein
MPLPDATQLPPPTNWQDFERLCLVLWQDIWADPDAQKNGRPGQAQNGIDIFGRPDQKSKYVGIQCKCKDQQFGRCLTEEELRDAVSQAADFRPPLSGFILATTAQQDVAIQEVSRELTETNIQKGLFSVSVWFWESIREELSRRPRILSSLYPNIFIGPPLCPDNDRHAISYAASLHSGDDFPLPASCISILLPRTGPQLFGRDKELQLLNIAWEDSKTHIIVLQAFGGVGKSTLLHHWLQAMSRTNYSGADHVYARSFYHQGTVDRILSADAVIAEALSWFGDADPKAGYPGEKGERLARMLKTRRALFVLDGLEVVQFPPGFQEGTLRDEGLRVLLRELAASNSGLCVISTRIRIADLVEFENSTVQCIELDNLSSEAGAQLLTSLHVNGEQQELKQVSQDFSGHPLALNLLGSYLRKAYHGDVQRASEVRLLEADAKQGGHAIRVMQSYAEWLGAGPEHAVLRMIGLFERSADSASIEILRSEPAIRGLEDASERVNEADWNSTISNLRDADLLAEGQSDCAGVLEAHPLVREYFGSHFQRSYPDGWREGHRRLYEYLKMRTKEYPETIGEMGPLFAAVAHGCKAGLHEQVLVQIYRSRLMRGDVRYASSKLAAFGPLLGALAHFFERADWRCPVHCLSKSDRMYVLNQAALCLSVTKGYPATEAKQAYKLACQEAEEIDSIPDHFLALRGLWRCSQVAADYKAAWLSASKLAEWCDTTRNPIHVAEANFALGATEFYLGHFRVAREHLERALAAYGPDEPHSGMGGFDVRVASLCYTAWALWYLGCPDTACASCNDALLRARVLSDHHTLALALHFSANLAQFCGDSHAVQIYSAELVDLASKYGFVHWFACGSIMQGCASVMQERPAEGIKQIHDGIVRWKSANAKMGLTSFLCRLAHAHARAHERANVSDKARLLREAFVFLEEGFSISAESSETYYVPELYRIKGELNVIVGQGTNTARVSSFDSAERLFRLAIQSARDQGAKSLELRGVNSLSRLLILRGRFGEAKQIALQFVSCFVEGHHTYDYMELMDLLNSLTVR